MTYGACWSVLTILGAMALSPCTEGSAAVRNETEFPVNDIVSAKPDTNDAPAAITKFFDATKIDSRCPNDTTCVYLQTFLTGATREITLTVSPGRKYAAGRATPGSFPISDFKFTSSTDRDSTVRMNMSYYVANA